MIDGERHRFQIMANHDSGQFGCGFVADRDGRVAIRWHNRPNATVYGTRTVFLSIIARSPIKPRKYCYAFTTAFALGDFLIFTAVTMLLGVTFVSIAIAFSSMTRSSSIAIGGAITLVLLFIFFWTLVTHSLIPYVAQQLSLMDPSATLRPDWILFLERLNPTSAYMNAVSFVLFLGNGTQPSMQNMPFYLENWFGFVILGFWLVVPIGLAYLRFERADL